MCTGQRLLSIVWMKKYDIKIKTRQKLQRTFAETKVKSDIEEYESDKPVTVYVLKLNIGTSDYMYL